MFGHCYKQQRGWEDFLSRFVAGGISFFFTFTFAAAELQAGGKLWDMEFLVDDNGRRIAAFGKSAGAVGN